MTELIEYTGDGDNERQSEFHDLDLDEIGSAACEALKAACEARNKWMEGREEWIEETLRLARLLVEGRTRFPSNDAFGNWIDSIKGLSLLSHQDRAALIQLGRYPAITRDVLEKTRRNSWREIWDKEAKRVIEPSESRPRQSRLTSPGKTTEAEEESQGRYECEEGEHAYIFPEDKVQQIDELLGNDEEDACVRDVFIDEAIEREFDWRKHDAEGAQAFWLDGGLLEKVEAALKEEETREEFIQRAVQVYLELREMKQRDGLEQIAPEAAQTEAPKKKRGRGRPKGSKNK